MSYEVCDLSEEVEFEEDVAQPKDYSFFDGCTEMIINGPLNILFVCIPLAFISDWAEFPEWITFTCSLLAIAPLAERLGFCTEQLALHTNSSIGGLLNASFGNATELIISISALSKGHYRVVQLSLLGSSLSNLTLVLGCSFLAGGCRFQMQHFQKTTSQVNSALLIMAAVAIVSPSILKVTDSMDANGVLWYSRCASFVLFGMYGAYLFFQLGSHAYLFDDEAESNNQSHGSKQSDIEMQHLVSVKNPMSPTDGSSSLSTASLSNSTITSDMEEEEEDEDVLGFWNAILWLGIVTLFISFLSDFVVSTIKGTSESLGLSTIFISAIIIPIIGNVAEHAGAVMFAMKNKLDLSLGIAVGSSTQIALMVLPLMVIISWCVGRTMTLDMGLFESTSLFFTVVLVSFMLSDGSSTWLSGAILCATYLLISFAFMFHVDTGTA